MRLSTWLAALAALAARAAAQATAPAQQHLTATPHTHSARRCGSAVYSCTPRSPRAADSLPAPPAICVNLCVKGAEPPKEGLPSPDACGPPCTSPAEACVLAARAEAASVGTGGGDAGSTEALNSGGSAAAPAAAPAVTHADFEAVFEGLGPEGEACPLIV